MRVEGLVWDEKNIPHILRHGITPKEVEEAYFDSKPLVEKGRGGSRKLYYLLSQSKAGRYIFVVFEYLGRRKARPITARDMDDSERRRYLRKVKRR